MKAITAPLILSSSTIFCLVDNSGSYDYSLKNHPEITEILNDREEYNGCGTFVDMVSGVDKIFALAASGDTEIYLVSYINSIKEYL